MTDPGNVTFRIADGRNDVRTSGTICASSKAFVTFDNSDAESLGHPISPRALGNAANRIKDVKYIIDGYDRTRKGLGDAYLHVYVRSTS